MLRTFSPSFDRERVKSSFDSGIGIRRSAGVRIRRRLLVRKPAVGKEELTQEPVERLPIVQAVVVPLIEIRMIAETPGLPHQTIERLRGHQ